LLGSLGGKKVNNPNEVEDEDEDESEDEDTDKEDGDRDEKGGGVGIRVMGVVVTIGRTGEDIRVGTVMMMIPLMMIMKKETTIRRGRGKLRGVWMVGRIWVETRQVGMEKTKG